MAIKRINSVWCPQVEAYRWEFVLDSPDDVANLPKACAGSTAMVVDGSGKIYMVNASGEWKEF
jgi:hypothetical protein